MKQSLSILTRDKFPLPAHLFEAKLKQKAVILLCTGLGIPKEVYRNYGQFLSTKGYTTLIFDYRGIGKVPVNFPAEQVNLSNWAKEDIPACIRWLKKNYPTHKLYLFGHSIGGQIAGMVPNIHLVDRLCFFSSTGGYWSLFDFPLNLFTIFMFYLHIPLTANILGYMPRSLTYRGVSIAKGVALEWAAWSRKRKYISAVFGAETTRKAYQSIKQNIDWIWFADDAIATERAVQFMMDYYPAKLISKHKLFPDKLGLPRIGHAGFFSRKAEKIWSYPLEILEQEV